MALFFESIENLPGIGPKKKEQLASVGIRTVQDALFYAPLRYEDRRGRKNIADLSDGEKAGVLAVAVGKMSVRKSGGKSLYTQTFRDGTGTLRVTWQNSPYLTRTFVHGASYVLYGRAFVKGGTRQMFAPLHQPAGQVGGQIGAIVPIYPANSRVSQTLLLAVISKSLGALSEEVPDLLPAVVQKAAEVMPLSKALYALHRPTDMEEAAAAQDRLKFEELFLLFLGMRLQRKGLEEKKGQVLSCPIDPFYKNLPFCLTEGQKKAVEDICRDMQSGRPMNRLIEGDVGSGKTAVAAAALYIAATCGRQAVLMAPTEILARQHAQSLRTLLPGMEICLLTGRLGAKERREAEAKIQDGRAQIIVGTQAVLSEKLNLTRVALAIVDEQHRFGVRQRGFLSGLSQSPHVLVMSATPIPRTLSLTYYGDLDISRLPARPAGRQRVDTFAVPPSYRERMYGFIRKELEKGNRAYIICPLVEEGENAADVESYAAALSAYFPKKQILSLAGKTKNKEEIMEAFATGEGKILVSTTVVEVGVDVPDATVMVVENAERFGLSQLHQLRGRVGRGKEKSYCILVSEPHTKEAQARLETMKKENDGFKIAEEDLRLRGPGEFFGVRQHGEMQLLYADVLEDSHLVPRAAECADSLLSHDPDLSMHPQLGQAVEGLYARFAMN